MVTVVIDEREYRVPDRVADVIRKVIENADCIAEGSKVLRIVLRKETLKASIEEEV